MITINIHEAKANLSKYIALSQKGERVMICNRNVPIAELTAVKEAKPKKRKLGLAKGLGHVLDSFFDPLSDEELAWWNGEKTHPDDPMNYFDPTHPNYKK